MDLISLLLASTLVVDLHNSALRFKSHDCLIENVLHEARGESIEGQLAVIEVVRTRAARSDYPNTVCQVVHQPYQFSWTNPGALVGTPTQKEELEVARVVYSYIYAEGLPDSTVKGATHYLNPDVLNKLPRWYYTYEKLGRVGNHEFFKRPDRPSLHVSTDTAFQ